MRFKSSFTIPAVAAISFCLIRATVLAQGITNETAKLLASDGTAGDLFGYSVSISGDAAIVGARHDDNGVNSGSAYVYRYNPKTMLWTEEQKLLASDGAAGDEFGISVAISGDVAIVGAVFDDASDVIVNSGSAYVYRFDGMTWAQEQKLLASDGAANDQFGISVAISGDAAIVGAYGDDDNGVNSGSAYVYRFDGMTWAEEQKFLASDGAAADLFGISVAISGDAAIVGAQWHDDNGPESGSAYVYRFDGMTWAREQELLASDGAANDRFGFSVAISGDIGIVGAYLDDPSTTNSGSAYVFRYNPKTMMWTEEQKLVASDGALGHAFGISVAISGNVVTVGAFFGDGKRFGTGSAYVYRFDGMTWLEEQKLVASDGAANDQFGVSVAISGDVAIVGAWIHADNGTNSGAAYVFDAAGPPGKCPWDLDANSSVGAADLLALLVGWGPCKGCPADFDGNGSVGASDLLALLVNWGPCP